MLTDKVVVITGGAGLLGKAFVRAVTKQGGIAVVADLDTEGAARLVEEVNTSRPGSADAVRLNVTDKASVKSLIAAVQERHGRLDAVVNSAYPRNRNYGRRLEEVSYEDFCENVSRHLGGYFLVAQQFGLFFRAHGGGNIINLASVYGTMPPRFDIYAGTEMTMPVEYAAIKSAVIQLTRYFAQYFKDDGIRVNCLSPGGILDKQPESFLQKYNAHCGAKGMLDPVDITGALLFLLADASKFVTGQNLVVDDGFSL